MHKSQSLMEIKLQKKISRAIANASKEPLSEKEKKRIQTKVISGLTCWYIEEVKRQNLNFFRNKAFNMIRLETEVKD